MADMRWVSLRYRLPALIAVVLVVAVAAFGAIAYNVVRQSTLEAAMVRLRSVADRYGALMGRTSERLRGVSEAATNPLLVRALTDTAAVAVALPVLERLGPDTGQLVSVELRDPEGRPVLALDPARHLGPRPRPATDAAPVMGPLFRYGDSVFFELTAPVRSGDRVVGWLAETRRVRSTQNTIQVLNELAGPGASLLLGNRDGSVWTDLRHVVDRPPPSPAGIRYRRAGQTQLAQSAPIRNTPFVIAVEFPEQQVLAPARTLVWTFAGVALLVIGVGTVVGVGLSRRVTDPLVQLTVAAETIATGRTPAGAVPVGRDDEIGRLARAFTVMEASVSEAREALEQKVVERTEELRTAQDALVRKERLATLGQLSSSVGHELRNPLGVMSNAVQVLEASLAAPPARVGEYLALLRRQIGVADKIVGDLLDFTRIQTPDRAPVSVARVVEEQLTFVAVPPEVRLTTVFQAGLDPAYIDRVQVGQVVSNLMSNAIQAMDPDGGVLTIRAESENGTVRLEVEDTGPGVPDDLLDRIFEPLFTTKARGIGLGLSISRTLALANGGDLRVMSGRNGGACFVLELPSAAEPS